MTLPDQLPIKPFTNPVRGEVELPGSKSLTNRALLLAALCAEDLELTGALFSDDTRLMIAALKALGFTVNSDETRGLIHISNQIHAFSGQGPVELFVGLAGTAARFLTALCAAAPSGEYRIDGVPQMRKRPMKGLIDALRQLGAQIECEPGRDGFFPITIKAHGLRGGDVEIDARDSSQMLSALMMIAPLCATPLNIIPIEGFRKPFVEMTARLMAEFGVNVKIADDCSHLVIGHSNGETKYQYQSPKSYRIEPDATAASYFLALPYLVGGKLYLPGLLGPGRGLQGDTRFIEVMQSIGLGVTENTSYSDGKTNGITVSKCDKQFSKSSSYNFNEFSDTFLTLAVLAPLLKGPTKIIGISHTRKQETDRVAGMAKELTRLGQYVIEEEDSLEIHPRPIALNQTIQTYHDHRFAMSFGILGSLNLKGSGEPWLTIDNPGCCEKTFPHFFSLLDNLRLQSSI